MYKRQLISLSIDLTETFPVPARRVKSVPSLPSPAVPSMLGRVIFAFADAVVIVKSLRSARTKVSSVPLPSVKVTAPPAVRVGSAPVNWKAPAPPLLVTVKAPPKL